MYYGVENGFAAILDVPGQRVQSAGEPVADGPIVGRSYTHSVSTVVGTEKIGQDRKRIHQ